MACNVAIVMVCDEGSIDDWVGELLADRIVAAGHCVVTRLVVPDVETKIRARLVTLISNKVDLVIGVGGVASAAAPRALAPLVTEPQQALAEQLRRISYEDLGSSAMLLDAQLARCGSTTVILMPASPAAMMCALDRVVVPWLRTHTSLTAPNPHLTTDSIAVIGDLPRHEEIDLRGAGKRGLWMLAGLAAAALAGVTALTVNIVERNRAITASLQHHEVIADETPDLPPAPPTTLASPAAQMVPAKPPKPVKAAGSKRSHSATKPALTEPATEVPQPGLQGSCDEVSCALHDNERECCTPYRPASRVPDKLDRTLMESALAGVKTRVIACAKISGPETDTTMSVGVKVRANGQVVSVIIHEAAEASLGECVVSAIRDTTFPVTQEGGSFTYRFAP